MNDDNKLHMFKSFEYRKILTSISGIVEEND